MTNIKYYENAESRKCLYKAVKHYVATDPKQRFTLSQLWTLLDTPCEKSAWYWHMVLTKYAHDTKGKFNMGYAYNY